MCPLATSKKLRIKLTVSVFVCALYKRRDVKNAVHTRTKTNAIFYSKTQNHKRERNTVVATILNA